MTRPDWEMVVAIYGIGCGVGGGVLTDDVRNLHVGSGVGCLMSGIYVLAVVLVV